MKDLNASNASFVANSRFHFMSKILAGDLQLLHPAQIAAHERDRARTDPRTTAHRRFARHLVDTQQRAARDRLRLEQQQREQQQQVEEELRVAVVEQESEREEEDANQKKPGEKVMGDTSLSMGFVSLFLLKNSGKSTNK